LRPAYSACAAKSASARRRPGHPRLENTEWEDVHARHEAGHDVENQHMDIATIFLLFGAGLAGGVMAAMVGGASVITFPVLIATGLNPVVATASNLIAVSPGNFFAALADRSQLPPFNRAFVGLVASSVLGAFVGAALLLATPARLFEILIPILLGFATVLFACAGRIVEALRARARARGGAEPRMSVTNLPMLVPVSLYGGYFGAGVGVLLLGVLSIATGGDYRSANVAKNLVTALNTFAASVIFIGQGAVAWPQTLAMMAGCMIGGYCGAQFARRVPQHVMRVVVVAVGALLTVVFAWRYWF
jgi:uncharacterized membrane protein YfcA